MPGTNEFDVDPDEWRKQFWSDDASAKADATPKGNGADSSGWGEPYMGVLRLRRRPPPALPLEVFGETWKKWLTRRGRRCGLPGRLCRRAIARKRLDADRQRAVGASRPRMERTAAPVGGRGWRQRQRQVSRRRLFNA